LEHRSERRLVTCVFIDIVGSTNLGQRLGPERMQRLLSDSFREISAIATAAGGTVEKYIGDEVFILFGAPVGHVDDVRRALRVADACARLPTSAHEAVAVRVGVETGEALVDLAAVEDRQRMAVGTCVNVAARLQGRADAGQVLVGPTCHAAAGSFGLFADVGELDLKGVGKVPAWRLLQIVEGSDVPLAFVGRNAELARLRSAFDRTRGGRATLALVTGEAGIGKSRLVEEFARSVTAEARSLRTRIRPGPRSAHPRYNSSSRTRATRQFQQPSLTAPGSRRIPDSSHFPWSIVGTRSSSPGAITSPRSRAIVR